MQWGQVTYPRKPWKVDLSLSEVLLLWFELRNCAPGE